MLGVGHATSGQTAWVKQVSCPTKAKHCLAFLLPQWNGPFSLIVVQFKTIATDTQSR